MYKALILAAALCLAGCATPPRPAPQAPAPQAEAPASAPAPAAKTLSVDFRGSLRDAIKKIAEQGGVVKAQSPEEFRSWLKDATARWGTIIREAGIKGS